MFTCTVKVILTVTGHHQEVDRDQIDVARKEKMSNKNHAVLNTETYHLRLSRFV